VGAGSKAVAQYEPGVHNVTLLLPEGQYPLMVQLFCVGVDEPALQ
jgi:hypothetical protein